jgi:hypothetical protein
MRQSLFCFFVNNSIRLYKKFVDDNYVYEMHSMDIAETHGEDKL